MCTPICSESCVSRTSLLSPLSFRIRAHLSAKVRRIARLLHRDPVNSLAAYIYRMCLSLARAALPFSHLNPKASLNSDETLLREAQSCTQPNVNRRRQLVQFSGRQAHVKVNPKSGRQYYTLHRVAAAQVVCPALRRKLNVTRSLPAVRAKLMTHVAAFSSEATLQHVTEVILHRWC
jgi:hypothetical protein